MAALFFLVLIIIAIILVSKYWRNGWFKSNFRLLKYNLWNFGKVCPKCHMVVKFIPIEPGDTVNDRIVTRQAKLCPKCLVGR